MPQLVTNVPQHLDLLRQISRIVSSGESLESVLQELVQLTVQVTGCDACLVYLAEHSTGDVILRASQLNHDAEIGTVRLRPGEGITGWVAERRAIVAMSANAFRDPRFKYFPGLVEDTFEALLSVPIISGGQVIGVINVHYRDRHSHTSDEIALVSFVGEQMGNAIVKAQLREENNRLIEEALEAKQQLATRKVVERAKGILQSRHNLTEESAYLRLRNESRRARLPMRALAEAIILAEGVAPKGVGSAPINAPISAPITAPITASTNVS